MEEGTSNLSMKLVALLNGISTEEVQKVYEEAKEKAEKDVRMISRAEIIDAVGWAFSKECDFITALALGSRISERMIEKLFNRQEGEE